jgi:hypothetical protein
MTPDEVLALPVTVDVVTAGRCWGLGRNASYRLARESNFPVPVLTLGKRLMVTRSSVLTALGIAEMRTTGPPGPVAATDAARPSPREDD